MSEYYNSRKKIVQGHGNFELKLLMSAFFTQNFKKVPKRRDFVSKLGGGGVGWKKSKKKLKPHV